MANIIFFRIGWMKRYQGISQTGSFRLQVLWFVEEERQNGRQEILL